MNFFMRLRLYLIFVNPLDVVAIPGFFLTNPNKLRITLIYYLTQYLLIIIIANFAREESFGVW